MSDLVLEDLFPADDELGRWVFGLCLARSDLSVSYRLVADAVNGGHGWQLHFHRILTGQIFEAALLIRRAEQRPVIREFVESWPSDKQEDWAEMRAPGFLKDGLGGSRNLTFHYPSGNRDDVHGGPALVLALHDFRSQPLDLELVDGRYLFADEIAAHFSSADLGTDQEELRGSLDQIKTSVERFGLMADFAFQAFRALRLDG